LSVELPVDGLQFVDHHYLFKQTNGSHMRATTRQAVKPANHSLRAGGALTTGTLSSDRHGMRIS
jgi:hypothetical protein